MLQRLLRIVKRGPNHLARRAYYAAFPPRPQCLKMLKETLRGRGLEIGGPSEIFASVLPVYGSADLDNCNFAASTVWEGSLAEGKTFHYGGKVGQQFVSEAFALPVASASYDFIISSHMLEHSANPIKVLHEWRRALISAGHLLLVLPYGPKTMDHRRPITTLAHLIADFDAGLGEGDLTHVDELIRLHDLEWTPEYRTIDELREVLEKNLEHRQMHHHVFDERLAVDLVRHAGFAVLSSEVCFPFHIVVLAKRLS
jgi:SAM-dependent methyltransferase